MLKLQTPVETGRSSVEISRRDSVLVLGSCFASLLGSRLSELGYDCLCNPFGTLYNPVSVCNAIDRLSSGTPFTEEDCVQMGAGSQLICSYSHHTSFARESAGAFLQNANEALRAACEFYTRAGKVLITLGTAWCWTRGGEVVANCLKRPTSEFGRTRLQLPDTVDLLEGLLLRDGGRRKFIFTVSPIRHMGDGAHSNQLSKSILLLAEEAVCRAHPGIAEYFPAYEIVLDELRDYRFYADDMLHPSSLTENYVWERFVDFAVPQDEREALAAAAKEAKKARHRSLH